MRARRRKTPPRSPAKGYLPNLGAYSSLLRLDRHFCRPAVYRSRDLLSPKRQSTKMPQRHPIIECTNPDFSLMRRAILRYTQSILGEGQGGREGAIRIAKTSISRTGTARFGPFVFWPAARRLEKDGVPIRLGGRALDILTILIDAAGKIVSYQELQDRVWQNINVDPTSLRVQMMALRKALREGETAGQYIATIAGRGYCFVAPVLRPLPELDVPAREDRIVLPKLVPLVGRDETVSSVIARLVESRFVTVTGTGGVGKTAVAVAVAHALVPAFEGAVYFVDLSAAASPQAALAILGHTALASPIDLGESAQQIVEALRGRRTLLVLDCVDRLTKSMAKLATSILSETKEVHVLATSREILGGKGEAVIALPPLAYPDNRACLNLDRVNDYAAVRLLLDLVTREAGGLRPGPDDVHALALMAAQLEGLPLALELAAGSIVRSGVAQTASIIGSRFALFLNNPFAGVPRHLSLNATLEWSYSQLTAEERTIFRNLSVFAGGFSLEGIRDVAAGPDMDRQSVAAAAAALEAKSLMYRQEDTEQPRYSVLDTTRAFALSKLLDSGDEKTIRRRHAEYITAYMIEANSAARGLRIFRGSDRVAANIHNICVALEWCFSPSGDTMLGARLAAESGAVFITLLMNEEGLRWLKLALSKLDDHWAGTKLELHIRVAIISCLIRWSDGVHEIAIHLPAAIELADKFGDGILRAESRAWDCMLLAQVRPIVDTIEVATKVRAIALSTDDYPTQLVGDWLLGFAYHLRGELHRVAPLCASAATLALSPESIFISTCQTFAQVCAIGSLARTMWLQGKPDMALSAARAALDQPGSCIRDLENSQLFFIPLFIWAGAWEEAEASISELWTRAGEGRYRGLLLSYKGSISLKRGQLESAILLLEEALGKYPHSSDPGTLATDLAEALALCGQFEAARQAMETAFASAERLGETFFFPELYRVMGVVMAIGPPEQAKDAEIWFLRAIECASRQGSLGFELRAATSLARLYQSAGHTAQARDMVAATYNRFTEGFDTPDLVAARLLLEQLNESLNERAATKVAS
jgi:predicted ATPase/DNA-binding winged helix-turn-helix (wHTH) protein